MKLQIVEISREGIMTAEDGYHYVLTGENSDTVIKLETDDEKTLNVEECRYDEETDEMTIIAFV